MYYYMLVPVFLSTSIPQSHGFESSQRLRLCPKKAIITSIMSDLEVESDPNRISSRRSSRKLPSTSATGIPRKP